MKTYNFKAKLEKHEDMDAARIIEVPEDLIKELQENKLEEVFAQLSYSKQKAQVESIISIETRNKRIAVIIDGLKN